MPEEWPIAATAADREGPARSSARGRLSTVRTDFFLDPAGRLTERERALMTAMLHCLIGDIAAEIRAGLPTGWVGANDDTGIVDRLTRAGLLDDPELIAILLRAADEQGIGAAARGRSGRQDGGTLQGLVSNEDGAVSAAAMALILARGRRRDRFGQCLITFDDLRQATADRLVHAIAAALRRDVLASQSPAKADSELSRVAADLLKRHDHSRSLDALTAVLAGALDEAGAMTDDLLRACGQDGELRFLAHALGRRAGVDGEVASDALLSGDARELMTFLRIAGLPRDVCASFLAGIGDLLGIADPGAAIDLFDALSSDEIESAAMWLKTSASYRAALDAIGADRG